MNPDVKRVCLLSPLPPPYGGMAIQAEKLAKYLEEEGFQVVRVRTNVMYPGRLSWVSSLKGVRTVVNTALMLATLHRALKQCQVVYFLTGFFNFFFWITYPALLLIKLHRKKVILSARGGNAARFFQKWKFLVAPILNRVDIITSPSGFLRDAFVEALSLEPQVVPNIADLDQFAFRERNPLRPRLIVTRSLEDIYNVECVLKAFSIIHDWFPESTLSVVGDGSQREMLEGLTQTLGLDMVVSFHGRVNHEGIQFLYAENDIFINASNVDNFPGTILEAFACGLPVVSTNAGGIPYMVEHGKTGLLVEKNDCQGLADQVRALLTDQNLATTLVNNAYRECEQYTWKEIRRKILPLLAHG